MVCFNVQEQLAPFELKKHACLVGRPDRLYNSLDTSTNGSGFGGALGGRLFGHGQPASAE